ncbi:MAG: ABC transporter permease [Rhodospirillales bacterium]|nr:ABC transporter permease [Rhodospirillales bacterium]
MTGTATGTVTRPEPDDRSRLLARTQRQGRIRTLRALVLVLPMFGFLLLVFLVPLGRMLYRSVEDPELTAAMPATAHRLRDWDGAGLPPREVYAALLREAPEAYEARTLATVAQRLNHDISGYRSLLLKTGRALAARDRARVFNDPAKRLVGIDARWGEPQYWRAMRRAAGPFTDLYLLAAVDLDRDATGDIVPVPEREAVFVDVLLRTLWIGSAVTILCLVLGYPISYLLATLPPRLRNVLMILVLLPFWTSLLVRTSAWIVVLQNEGIVNGLLLRLGIIDAPVQMIFNRFGVLVAMTHVLLPFMVMPLYSVMRGISPAHMRAAASLGAPPWLAFLRVYLPQSMPGVAAGCLLVFILGVGYYITPALVGGASDQMVSYFIAFYTNRTVNWGLASALASVLLVATVALCIVYARLSRAGGGLRP